MQDQDATTDLKVFLLPRAAVVLKWLCPLFESTISSLVFNCAAGGGVLLEIVCQSESCSESTAFSLQGMLVLLLGLDTLVNLLVHLFKTSCTRPAQAQNLQSCCCIHVATASCVDAACNLMLLFTQVL